MAKVRGPGISFESPEGAAEVLRGLRMGTPHASGCSSSLPWASTAGRECAAHSLRACCTATSLCSVCSLVCEGGSPALCSPSHQPRALVGLVGIMVCFPLLLPTPTLQTHGSLELTLTCSGADEELEGESGRVGTSWLCLCWKP